MQRSALWGRLLFMLALPAAVRGSARAVEVELGGHTFTLPDGFTLELAAEPPLIERPIVADFDDRGRLYVAEASGTNDPVAKQVVDKPHRIVRLVDTDNDGVYDKRTVYADKLMLPEGVMWLDGSLYVGAPPSIWKLTDTDGDGVADEREEWFQGKTLTGCANDIHGPFRGPDGWIYWCKGAFAEQTYERAGKPPFVTRAAHIFRARPDGTGVEPVMTGGMDNPVELVFTSGGERIFTTTFFQHPGGGRRDGLIHAIYGGVYGKQHDVLNGHIRTGPDLMPVLTQLGPAAPCGLLRYESGAFGKEYRDDLFAALFNLHKVTRHRLLAEGSTFQTVDSDFLSAADFDFHPTDVLEDADGSLLVVDTGGWYKLCCPTSQLVKPDVLGGIYRVRKVRGTVRDAAARKRINDLTDHWGKNFNWSQMPVGALLQLAHSDRPAIAHRAADELVRYGNAGAEAIQGSRAGRILSSTNADVRILTRIDDPLARQLVRRVLRIKGNDEVAGHAAILSTGLWRDREAVPPLIGLLSTDTTANRRAAAEALGRIGDPVAVPALLTEVAKTDDPILQHSLIYALIEIGDPESVTKGLKSTDFRTRRAALIALDQMPGEHLTPEVLTGFLTDADVEVVDAATWIAGQHPQWADRLAGYFRQRLEADDIDGVHFIALERQLAPFAQSEPIQNLLAERLGDLTSSDPMCRLVLQTMAQSHLKSAPETWIAPLRRSLASRNDAIVAEAVRTARALDLPPGQAGELGAQLIQVSHAAERDPDLRLDALTAVPGGLAEVDTEIFSLLRAQLQAEAPAGRRSAAVAILSKAKLTSAQLIDLAADLREAGPLEIEKLVAAFAQSNDEQVGAKLVEALAQARALPALHVEMLKPVLEKFGPEIKEPAEALYVTLTADSKSQTAGLDALLAELKDGDIRRGQAIFNSSKAACASCHAIGYVGGNIGPDLTRIGQIRTERDLIESIVFPSASFVRSYEPVQVQTVDGKVYNGLVRGDTAGELTLATGAKEQVRIARDEIEEMQPGKVSLMPAGLDKQLSHQELADLLAFLKACR